MSAMWRDMKWRRISEINVPATLSLKSLLWSTNIKIVDKKTKQVGPYYLFQVKEDCLIIKICESMPQ